MICSFTKMPSEEGQNSNAERKKVKRAENKATISSIFHSTVCVCILEYFQCGRLVKLSFSSMSMFGVDNTSGRRIREKMIEGKTLTVVAKRRK